MAIALVGTCVSAYAENLTKAVTNGNLLVFGMGGIMGTITTPVSSGVTTTTWTLITNTTADGDAAYLWWAKATGTGDLTVTASGGTAGDRGCSLHEYSGADTSSPVDKYDNVESAGSVALIGVAANTVIVAYVNDESMTDHSPLTNYIQRTEELSHWHGTCDRLISVGGDYTAGYGGGQGAVAASFKEAAGGVTIPQDASSLTASGGKLTVVPGAVSVTLDAAGLTAVGGKIAASEAFTVAVDAAALTVSGGNIAISESFTVGLDAAALSVGAGSATIVPGAVSVALGAAALTSSGGAITLSTGETTIALNAGALALGAGSATLAPGEVTTSLDAAALTLSGGSATASEAFTVSLDAAALSVAGGAIAVSEAFAIALDAASLTVSGGAATLVPGEATIAVDAGALTVAGGALAIVGEGTPQTVALDAAAMTVGGALIDAFLYATLHPSADRSLGDWTDQDYGTTNIYATIDEDSADDNDYIQSPNNASANIYKCKIETAQDPGIHTYHDINYRYRKPDSAGTVELKVRLLVGNTTIKEWTHSNIGTDWTDGDQTLDEADAANITDYADLFLEFEATAV